MAQGEVVCSLQPLARLGLNPKDQALAHICDALTPRGRLSGLAGVRQPASRGSREEPSALEEKEHVTGSPETQVILKKKELYFSTHPNRTLTCDHNRPRIFDGNKELKAFFPALHSQWNHPFIHHPTGIY